MAEDGKESGEQDLYLGRVQRTWSGQCRDVPRESSEPGSYGGSDGGHSIWAYINFSCVTVNQNV